MTASVWGAEIVGRITYMSADRKQLMLDNSQTYTLTNSPVAESVGVGDRVELKLDGKGNGQVSKIDKLS